MSCSSFPTVAVYSRIAAAVRNGLLTPGSIIPTEAELGTDMKVNRTVVGDGEAIARLQENVRAQPVSFGKGAAEPLEIEDDGGATLLAALNKQLGRLAGRGQATSR